MNVRLQLPHFQQSADGYCLPACVRMVLAYWGLQRSEAEIGRILGARTFGTPSFAVKRLTQWGAQVLYCEWSVAQLLNSLAAKQPIIAFLPRGFWITGNKMLPTRLSWLVARKISGFGFTIRPYPTGRFPCRGTVHWRPGLNSAIAALQSAMVIQRTVINNNTKDKFMHTPMSLPDIEATDVQAVVVRWESGGSSGNEDSGPQALSSRSPLVYQRACLTVHPSAGGAAHASPVLPQQPERGAGGVRL